MRDPYEVLGVSKNASDDEIKRTYRELSRKYHPDSYVDNPLSDLAEEKFKEIQEAYKSIMDMRSGNNSTYNQNSGYGSGQYTNGNNQNQWNNSQGQYQSYGNGYGRNPYGQQGGSCGTGNLCCDLICADTLCECMGGDLCSCF